MKSVYEHIQVNDQNPFKISVFNRVKFNYPFHYHSNEYEITLTLGCEGYRIIGDRFGDFGSADLALIGPGLPHCWNTYNPKEIHTTAAKVIVIQFGFAMIEGIGGKQFFSSISRLLQLSSRGIVFGGRTLEKAKQMILQLKEKQGMTEFLGILEILQMLSVSRDYEVQCSAAYSFRGNNNENETFGKVYKYILTHYSGAIKLKEVADIAFLSESAFSHYFKKRTLKSFSDFVIELRLGHACRLMQTTDKSIADIAFESGFNNLSNFNRIFKKVKKITPHEQKRLYGYIQPDSAGNSE